MSAEKSKTYDISPTNLQITSGGSLQAIAQGRKNPEPSGSSEEGRTGSLNRLPGQNTGAQYQRGERVRWNLQMSILEFLAEYLPAQT